MKNRTQHVVLKIYNMISLIPRIVKVCRWTPAPGQKACRWEQQQPRSLRSSAPMELMLSSSLVKKKETATFGKRTGRDSKTRFAKYRRDVEISEDCGICKCGQ